MLSPIRNGHIEHDGPHVRPTICHVVHGLPIGGAEILVSRLVRALAGAYRVEIACLDEVGELGAQLRADGFILHELSRRPGFDWQCVRRLAALLKSRSIDVVHGHQYTPFAYAAATRMVGRRPPLVFTEHGRFFPDSTSRKRRLFTRLMTARSDRIVAVGMAVRDALVLHERLPADRIEIIYNGVDLPAVQASLPARSEVRAELQLTDADFMVLQVARLDSIKDHRTAVQAIRRAAAAAPHVKLFLVGDGPERTSIEQFIRSEQVETRVAMLGARRDVPRLLAAADAFLLTSVSEGIPVTIIEAMAAGAPVVSTAVGGVPEVVEDERTGLLAPAGNAPRLADAIVRLASDARLRAMLAAAAQQRAEEMFSEARMVESYRRLYDSMITPGSRRN